MLLRGWLDNLFMAPSGAAADAAEPDEDEVVDAADPKAEADVDPDDDDDGDEVPVAETEDTTVTETPAPRSYKDYGLPEDPEEAYRQYHALNQRLQQAEQHRQYLQFQQMQAEQMRQAAAQPTSVPEKPKLPWGEMPEFDPRWVNGVQRNPETGRLEALPGFQPDLPQKIEQYAQWKEEALRKFFTDPYAGAWDQFAPRVQETTQQQIQQALLQFKREQEVESYKRENASVLYDQTGNLTPYGQQIDQHYQYALQIGHPAPFQYAENMVHAPLALTALQQAQAQAAQPRPLTNAEKKLQSLKSSANGRNRDGTFKKGHRTTPAQNSKGNPFDALREAYKELPDEDFDLNE